MSSSPRRAWAIAVAIILLAMIGDFAYGIIFFLYGPIRQCQSHGYCDKLGQPHTLDDFQHFQLWQTSILIIWPIGLVLGTIFARKVQNLLQKDIQDLIERRTKQ